MPTTIQKLPGKTTFLLQCWLLEAFVGDEDVIVVLLLDAIDIDSKMLTFVKRGLEQEENVYRALYKQDLSKMG